jgi:hypothetical protein
MFVVATVVATGFHGLTHSTVTIDQDPLKLLSLDHVNTT